MFLALKTNSLKKIAKNVSNYKQMKDDLNSFTKFMLLSFFSPILIGGKKEKKTTTFRYIYNQDLKYKTFCVKDISGILFSNS